MHGLAWRGIEALRRYVACLTSGKWGAADGSLGFSVAGRAHQRNYACTSVPKGTFRNIFTQRSRQLTDWRPPQILRVRPPCSPGGSVLMLMSCARGKSTNRELTLETDRSVQALTLPATREADDYPQFTQRRAKVFDLAPRRREN